MTIINNKSSGFDIGDIRKKTPVNIINTSP